MPERLYQKPIYSVHHIHNVLAEFPGVTDLEEARRVTRKITIPKFGILREEILFRRKVIGSILTYPFLSDFVAREKFIESRSQMIVAVNTGNYDAIPDVDTSDRLNHDDHCKNCGNLESSLIDSGRPYCNIKKRLMALKYELEWSLPSILSSFPTIPEISLSESYKSINTNKIIPENTNLPIHHHNRCQFSEEKPITCSALNSEKEITRSYIKEPFIEKKYNGHTNPLRLNK